MRISLISVLGALVLFLSFGVHAVFAVTFITDVNIDQATLVRGYAVSSVDTNFNLIIRPGVLSNESRVVVKQLDPDDTNLPADWQRISDYYEYEVVNASALVKDKALVINIKLAEAQKNQKRIFVWDTEKNIWVEVSTVVRDAQNVRAFLTQPTARLVVLEKQIMELGQASWYKYKNCDCAASPDYPKGTKLKVKNIDNGKEVVVTVNDYGPDRSLFPNRVIDLDKIAFKKLGALSCGVLKNILVTLEK
ncbi:MAG: Rare lipoprotein A [Parcubacteria group bacterium GW2011_GWC2_39_14]|nr:MAG: Rare lipoprotein A [Parcubacteria group bacterium GW2011_GWC2_39_14]KKR55189.1 MAG: Rare lipoprotein A [Parcubacteria group bacterium GW2011_GWA2_40_23]